MKKKLTLTDKLIAAHATSGTLSAGEEVGLKIDCTLTQDATGTMAYLEFDAMGIGRVKTELSVAYVDHNTLGTGFENADDHRSLPPQLKNSVYGIAVPAMAFAIRSILSALACRVKLSLGSDSHTPTAARLQCLP